VCVAYNLTDARTAHMNSSGEMPSSLDALALPVEGKVHKGLELVEKVSALAPVTLLMTSLSSVPFSRQSQAHGCSPLALSPTACL